MAAMKAADRYVRGLGITFSPSGNHLYIADSGMAQAFFGSNSTFPSTM
jgi:gluconolactonase